MRFALGPFTVARGVAACSVENLTPHNTGLNGHSAVPYPIAFHPCPHPWNSPYMLVASDMVLISLLRGIEDQSLSPRCETLVTTLISLPKSRWPARDNDHIRFPSCGKAVGRVKTEVLALILGSMTTGVEPLPSVATGLPVVSNRLPRYRAC